MRDYIRAIDDAQALGGPYSTDLVDLYFGYAHALLEEGDLEGALDAFNRTVMITRVNLGPNSPEQSNYLYSIADIESQLGNLGEAVSVIQNIYMLHARDGGENNPQILDDVVRLRDWYVQTRPVRGPLTRTSDNLNRGFLADRVAELTESAEGLGSADAALQYREAAQVHFRSILHIARTAEPPQPELVISVDGKGSNLYFERAMSDHFKSGEMAMERAVASWQANPDAGALEVAESIAQLGDWYLALKHFRSAEKQYEKAYRLLASSKEAPHLADEYLGAPTPLRFLDNGDDFVRDLNPPLVHDSLAISMTVTRNGRLLGVQVMNPPEGETEEDIRNFTQRLENTRFRPAVINGKVEKLDHFLWKPPLISPKIAARND